MASRLNFRLDAQATGGENFLDDLAFTPRVAFVPKLAGNYNFA